MRNRYTPVLQEHAPPRVFDLDRLLDQGGVLEVDLFDEGGASLTLRFGDYLTYRKRDEGDALKTLEGAAASAKLDRSFYRVEDSDFLDWFVADSYGIRANDRLIHFAIMTIDDVIDVICFDEPVVVKGRR